MDHASLEVLGVGSSPYEINIGDLLSKDNIPDYGKTTRLQKLVMSIGEEENGVSTYVQFRDCLYSRVRASSLMSSSSNIYVLHPSALFLNVQCTISTHVSQMY